MVGPVGSVTPPGTRLQLGQQWAIFEGCGDSRPPAVVSSLRQGDGGGAVLQGGICAKVWKPGTWPLGQLVPVGSSNGAGVCDHPPAPVHCLALGAPERPDREDLPKYDRIAWVSVSVDGEVTVAQDDGVVARLQLGAVAWLNTPLLRLGLELEAETESTKCALVGCRRAGPLVFCEGIVPGMEYNIGEDATFATLPPDCRPRGGRRCYLTACCRGGMIHVMRLFLDASGRLSARRSHTQGRAKDGHIYEVAKRQPGLLELPIGMVRFATEVGTKLSLLADARAPRQYAARKQLSYLGLGSEKDGTESPRDLDGFQVASCTRHGAMAVLEGAVVLTARHRYAAFAKLEPDCRPSQSVTLLVARGLPNGRIEPERLDVTADGECLCPQLPEELGVEHVIHLAGAVIGVSSPADAAVPSDTEDEEPETAPPAAVEVSESAWKNWADDGYGGWKSSHKQWSSWEADCTSEEAVAWTRLQELQQRDRRYRGKLTSGAELIEFERTLQWFRAHDCTESHRLTHSCFKGRSDFTQTGMLVFDTEEDLEGLNKAIAWLFHRRVPVVLMERQTRVFPMIFDIDLKCTRPETIKAVPERLKRARPWQGPVDFCRWHGADWLVLGKDMELIRHLGRIIFQFFPDLPLLDLCIFNASGWDRVKNVVKVSLHLVAPYVLVTPERLTSIRERILEYLGECSEYDGHPIHELLANFLAESDDNTWEKVVDQTVTSGTNGLRMPYCDKAQRTLKREFADRKKRGEVFTDRELMDQHAYLREEAGRPCLPEGILRLLPLPKDADDFALPECKWMCKGDDLPIDEWIRLGRCRHSWRVPLAPPGPTPWRPPLKYQWAEPSALWEDRAELKGSPVVRRFGGTPAEFRARWDEALVPLTVLHGRWLSSATGARWRGGLTEGSSHEVRFVASAARVVLLLSPELGAARAFAEMRRALSGWTLPDSEICVPICGAPSDSHSSALHTIVTPSEDFPDAQSALDAVPVDEPLHRVLVKGGLHELPTSLLLRRPVMLEGEGRWETTLRTNGVPVIRFEGEGARTAMVRNLNLEMVDETGQCEGAPAINMEFKDVKGAEPAIVGTTIKASGRWGTCVRAVGGAPQIVRSRFCSARFGVVLVEADGRVEDNEFVGMGEAGLVLVAGAPWVHRNTISDCGGAGIIVASDCHAVMETNEVRDCLTGVRVVGKRAELDMRVGNRLLHNGLCDEHQLEAPPGVIPHGATATVRSCRPYPFLPKLQEELLARLLDCPDPVELTIMVRAARRQGLWKEAARAHKRLSELRRACPKGPPVSASPAWCEVAVASKAWDGTAAGYGERCAIVQPGALCEVWKRDPSGWALVATSANSRGWCSPHVLG